MSRQKNYSHSNATTEDDQDRDHVLLDHPLICDVWAHNFSEALLSIAQLAQTYNLIAIDTEFPGTPIKKHALAHLYPPEELDYQLLCHNVEKTTLIQVGVTLASDTGALPTPHSWQFHLSFDLTRQHVVPESIALLQASGIPFHRLAQQGIAPARFAEGLISSGLILNKSLRWVLFHGCYDLAYLLRLLRAEALPGSAEDFYKSIHVYFPNIYDLKEIVQSQDQLRDRGLNSIAERLGCTRIGPNHQAGSDSLLTLQAFLALREILGQSLFDKSLNVIYGVPSARQPKASQPSVWWQRGPLYQYMQQSQVGWGYYFCNSLGHKQ